MGEHRRTRGNDGREPADTWAVPPNAQRAAAGLPELPGSPSITRDWPAFERTARGLGSAGSSPADPDPRIPGDDRIRNTLENAGYGTPLYVDGVSPYVMEMAHHPAVLRHGKGMTPQDLASFTEALASLAGSRTRGIGAEQYYHEATGMDFEGMSPYQVAEMALEEFADVVNYAAMSAIKILAAVRQMGSKDA